MKIGIDASNIRNGGGLTHLRGILGEAEPGAFGIEEMVLWGSSATLELLPRRTWLRAVHEPLLDRALPWRVLWQQTLLPRALRRERCDALFAPGGTLPWKLGLPGTVLSQNLLPFEPGEAARLPLGGAQRLKLQLLRLAQARSVRKARAIAFLSRYAQAKVLSASGPVPAPRFIIPHGVEKQFFCEPRPPRRAAECSEERPFRFLYVSAVYPYKHHGEVARAAARLRAEGLPVVIDFVGPADTDALAALAPDLGPAAVWRGAVAYDRLPAVYRSADAFVFASSCENLPNVLLEAMASGLPIACSSHGPMPEVLADAGVYFNPYSPAGIALAMRTLFWDADLRARLAEGAYKRAQRFSWKSCAQRTLWMIAEAG